MKGGGASLVRNAALASGLMMAWQVASKTIRDSLFLTAFDARALPAMAGSAAVSAVLLAVVSAKLLHRFGPFRVIPAGYLLSMGLHAAEFLLLPAFPRPMSVLIYLHVVALGSVLLSGFWALANESFDPLEARRRFGRIAGFGTLGGLGGGLMMYAIAPLLAPSTWLLFLLALQLVCGVVLVRLPQPKSGADRAETPPLTKALAGAPYLLAVAGLVALVNMAAAALDFLFKAQAQAHIGRGVALTQFLALFWVVTSISSFVAQTGASQFWLNRFGLARTVATLPVGVAGASLLALISPGAIVLGLTRAWEQTLRGSLFRSGYELFYAPMPEAEKRSVKSVIDIGADRAGDGTGYAAVQLILNVPAAAVPYCILALVAAVSGMAAWLSFRLDRAYSLVIQKNLANNAKDLKPAEVEELTMVFRTAPGSATLPLDSGLTDAQMQQLTQLRSSDPRRVKEALREMGMLDPILVPQVIRLLASDSVCRAAHAALSRATFRIAGQLADALLDESLDYAVRRRIPRLLATCETHRAWDGLFEGLNDPKFELRFRCSRGLEGMLLRHPDFRPEPAVIYRLVERELSVSRREWQGRQPRGVEEESVPADGDAAAEEPVSHSLAHVFALLALVLPREAVRTAFRALHTDDSRLRALAVEYLGSSLPREIRDRLCERIELSPPGKKETLSQRVLGNPAAAGSSTTERPEDAGTPREEGKRRGAGS
ncbi:MAG: NTP/NDP exchange transporter [Acidobacteriia bacterium]|nr:NTP/NDP exchange transporter [Terriglobia bacterium]